MNFLLLSLFAFGQLSDAVKVNFERGVREEGNVCTPVSIGDHILITYNVRFTNGSIGPQLHRPEQLFHWHLKGIPKNSLAELVIGACTNETVIGTWSGKGAANLAPVISAPVALEPNVAVSVNITLYHVTTSAEYELFVALREERFADALDLLEKHIGVNAVNEWELTPLMLSVQMNDLMLVSELLNTNRPRVDVNKAKSSGHTAIFYAVQLASTSILRALLYRGADPNVFLVQAGSYGNTPLHIACLLEKPQHAKLLLEYGAKPFVLNEYGMTPSQLIPRDVTISNKLAFKKLFEVSIHFAAPALFTCTV